MVRASFLGSGGALNGFRVCGHSGYADEGSDIVCAAVSAAAMLTVNLLTESFKIPCELRVDEDRADIELRLERPDETGSKIISAFRDQLLGLAEEYPQNILVKE